MTGLRDETLFQGDLIVVTGVVDRPVIGIEWLSDTPVPECDAMRVNSYTVD